MTTTTHLGITLVEQSQAQKEVTVNQALTRIDAILNSGAKSRTTSTPPGSPASGDLYIVGASPSGAWAGQAGQLAYFDQTWKFIAPNEGVTLWVNDEDLIYSYNGSAWIAAPVNDQTGFVNKFRNAAFDIWQRGASGTITAGTPAHTADGWVTGCTGANVTWAQIAGKSLSAYSLKVTGNTGVTDTLIRQRIESFFCYPLAGKTLIFQAQIFNNTGGSITPTITVKHASAADNWSSPVTDVNAQSLQACANSAWTQVSYSFTAHASSGNGVEITIDFGSALSANTKFVQLAEADLRVGTIVGSPELRPISTEVPFNKRYYRRLGGVTNFIIGSGEMFSTTSAEIAHLYEEEMRSSPTIANSGSAIVKVNASATTKTSSAISWSNISNRSAYAAVTIAAVTSGDGCIAYIGNSTDYIEFSSEL
jgi:Protein of unknown function (DUF2793)